MSTGVASPRLTEAIETIRRHEPEWRAQRIRHVWVFGSVARGEDRSGSDLDILFEMERPFSLFDLGGAWVYFEALFGPSVDVLERTCIRPEIREDVLRDAVLAA